MDSNANATVPDSADDRFDRSWFDQLQTPSEVDSDAIHYEQVFDPMNAVQWRLASAVSPSQCAQMLRHEYSMASHMEEQWAEIPSAFLPLDDRAILVFPERRGASIEAVSEIEYVGNIAAFLDLGVNAAAAMSRMHEIGILHRAISASNVIIHSGGVRFSSFGSSALSGGAPLVSSHVLPFMDMAYVPPEQARRDQPSTDWRSDLYSLGVVLYQALTGELPLKAVSMTQWLHAHVAIEPARPSVILPNIPETLDSIVMKLIAKDPDQRYQSAHALRADLLRCRDEWTAAGEITDFPLGRADLPPNAGTGQQLFGRVRELKELVDAAKRTGTAGTPEIIFVRGTPGVGKSTLVAKLPKLLGDNSFRFASAKCELLVKDVPYASFSHILRSLISNALQESNEALDSTRQRLATAITGYGRLLVELVPDAEFLIGQTTALPDAPANVSQTRMVRVIVQTLSVFATQQNPLILFFDDLQWVDESTCIALRALLEHQLPYLLLVLAYRKEPEGHKGRLGDIVASAMRSNSKVEQIDLAPLTIEDTSALIGSILVDMPEADVSRLAQLVQKRTDGNAFFASQFLRSLVSEKAVSFDLTLQRWVWDESIVQGSNVIDFLVERIHALPAAQRLFLENLAVIGGQCEPNVLARIYGVHEAELELVAQPLLQMGFLSRQGVNYAIAHDRVLEAAHDLAAATNRPAMHLRIARLMLDYHGEGATDRVFEIARHVEMALGEGSFLLEAERLMFVRVLVSAARRARDTGAVEQSIDYLDVARAMTEPAWQISQRRLIFELEFFHCECLISLARIEEGVESTELLLKIAQQAIDKANVYRLKAIIATVKSDYQNAIHDALSGLELLGVTLPEFPTAADCDIAYGSVRMGLEQITLPGFVLLPNVRDENVKSAMALLSALSSSFFVKSDLAFLHTAKLVELTLQHGVTPDSAYGLAWFAVFCASRFGTYSDGFDQALAASDLTLRDGFETHRTATLIALDQITPWTQPLQNALSHAREAAEVGYAANDLGMTCYARNHIVSDLIALGTHLSVLSDEIEQGMALVRQVNYKDIEFILESQSYLVRGLQRGDYADQGMEQQTSIRSIPTLFWTDFYSGMTAYFFGDFGAAITLLERAMTFSWSVPAHIDFAYCHLFTALALAKQSPVDIPYVLDRLGSHRAHFVEWDRLNSKTFRSKLSLIDAEIARLRGEVNLAARYYERAISAAENAGFIHEQAVAHELAGIFYEANELFTAARSHFQAAFVCYSRWGADGKAIQLQKSFPKYFSSMEATRESASSGQDQLNLEVLLRSAQALSEEIVLERVVGALMIDMITHAGAQYGLLLMMRDGQPVIEAKARMVQHEVVLDVERMPPTPQALPLWILNAVIRTKKTIVFTDAVAEAPQVRIDGPEERNLRSVVCLPLNKRGALVGVIYLENNLAPAVFTASRISVLELLAPQAAISLEAARLYRDLAEENSRRAKTEADLMQARADLSRNSQLTILGGLAASISHEINQPLASIVSNADASSRWLKRPKPDVEEALAGLESITESGLRAAGIVKALRSLAKQTPAVLVRSDFNEIVTEVLRLTAPEIEKNRVRLRTLLTPQTNPVMADPVQLQQVVLNLITNAIDALSELPVERRELSIEVTQFGHSISVKVEDRGMGMDEAILQRIFDPFFSTKTSGMGMGLAICHSIMQAHGSRLLATSTLGEGTVFSFSLSRID